MSLLTLPDELLLEIFHKTSTRPRDRQKHLRVLALVCRKLQLIATELLLTSPSVHLFEVDKLVSTYFKYPKFATKAHTLELASISFDAEYERDPRSYDVNYEFVNVRSLNAQLRAKCVECIHNHKYGSLRWIDDLDKDPRNACLAVLLAVLPNLRTLLMGANLLEFYPLSMDLVEFQQPCQIIEQMLVHKNIEYAEWDHPYLEDLFSQLLLGLHTFELPLECYSARYQAFACLTRGLRTSTLRRVALPLELIQARQNCYDAFVADPIRILPLTLELLVFTSVRPYISVPSSGASTTPLDIDLFLRRVIMQKHWFPKLRHIELYNCDEPPLGDISELIRATAKAGMLLYLRRGNRAQSYYHQWAYGQAWRYTEVELQQLDRISDQWDMGLSWLFEEMEISG